MGRETEKVPGRRWQKLQAGSHSAGAKDKGNPAPPGVRAWEVLMNGSGGRGSRVWEAKGSLGKGWGDDRVVWGTPALGQGRFLCHWSSEVKAWQRRGDGTRQSRFEGEDLAIFLPASPRPLLSPQTSVSSHLVVMETGWNRTDGLH